MKVLITGANGQVGWELQRTAPPNSELFPLTHDDLDITNADTVMSVITEKHPDLIVNAAAYTAVDKAEQERDLAYAVNAHGAANIAQAAMSAGARLIHISTDFVFDGTKSRPYLPDDEPNPINVYGASKLRGEKYVSSLSNGQALILRTSWVYSCHGSNFVKTILRLLKERDKLSIVSDQVGTPTWAYSLAQVIWRSAEKGLSGIYNWTDGGVASWYDFAVAIQEESVLLGLLDRSVPIVAISSKDYQTLARRPAYSVLEKTKTCASLGVLVKHWQKILRNMLRELKE